MTPALAVALVPAGPALLPSTADASAALRPSVRLARDVTWAPVARLGALAARGVAVSLSGRLSGWGAEVLVDALVAAGGEGRVAAFDADGTLWPGDVGEALLRHLQETGRLPRGVGDAVGRYEALLARGEAEAAWAWCVEAMVGLEEAFVVRTCEALFTGRFYRPVVRVLERLRAAGFVPWVVSASPFWAVVPGAAALGIDATRVIGVRCDVRGGRLAGPVHRPVPSGAGKVEALAARGLRATVAVGNSFIDQALLESAPHALAVVPEGDAAGFLLMALLSDWAVLDVGCDEGLNRPAD